MFKYSPLPYQHIITNQHNQGAAIEQLHPYQAGKKKKQ
jgi:hypothetical protein